MQIYALNLRQKITLILNKNMNKSQLSKILSVYAMQFPNFKLDENYVRSLYRLLEVSGLLCAPDVFESALVLAIHESKGFFPDGGQISQKIKILLEDESETFDQIVDEVFCAVRKFGFYQKQEAYNAMSNKARMLADVHGWDALNNMQLSDKTTYIAQMRGAFENIDKRAKKETIKIDYSKRLGLNLNKMIKEIE